MSAPPADRPPADVLRGVSAYVTALEGLLRHAAAVRDEWQPLLDRYAAWLQLGDDTMSAERFAAAEATTGLGRAARLAGAVARLADEALAVGGADNRPDDALMAEVVASAP